MLRSAKKGLLTSFPLSEDDLEVLHRIETLVLCCLEELVTKRTHGFELTRRPGCNSDLSCDSLTVQGRSLTCVSSLRPYCLTWLVLATMYGLKLAGKLATQRDLYYLLLPHFHKQSELNAVVGDVVSIIHLPRLTLGVSATSRGFVSGLLRCNPLGEPHTWIDCSRLGTSGLAIPGALRTDMPLQCSATYILVVEKDAVFHRLTEDKFWKALPCVIVTGCGFPDLSTRILVWMLVRQFKLPIVGFVDWNPAGLHILLSYHYGSSSMGLASVGYGVDLHWGGLLADDVPEFIAQPGLALPFSPRDRRLATNLLQSPALSARPQLRDQLVRMQEWALKVELEALYGGDRGKLGNFIRRRILRHDSVPCAAQCTYSPCCCRDSASFTL